MKFLKYITIAAAALALSSCQEVDKTCALPADKVAAPVLDEHSDILVDADNLSSEVTFTWSAADYGYHAAVSYAIYGAYGDAEYQLAESSTTSYTFTKESLNNALVNSKGLGVPADETSTVFFYVVSSVSTDPQSAYTKKSNVIALDVTTIKSTSAPWIRRPLWIRGNFTGWNESDGPILWENGENSDVYEGLVFLGNAANTPNHYDDDLCHFKFCPNPGWNGNLGGDPDAMTTEGDPAHITAEEGLYWIKVTLSADHSTGSVKLTSVSAISVVGVYNSWGDTPDTDMTLAGMPADPKADDYSDTYYRAMIGQTWECTIPGFTGGEFKFRLNHAWADSWGGDNLDHINYNGSNCSTAITGDVHFTIDFHGDIAALAEDATNPSPVSATVSKVE